MENIMPEDAQRRFVTGEMKNTENILYCGVAIGYKCFDTNDYILRSFNNFSTIATYLGCYI